MQARSVSGLGLARADGRRSSILAYTGPSRPCTSAGGAVASTAMNGLYDSVLVHYLQRGAARNRQPSDLAFVLPDQAWRDPRSHSPLFRSPWL